MYLIGKIKVTPVLPSKIQRLKDIAYNLWWSWNSEAVDLFREIDLKLWEKTGKNPVRFLQEVNLKTLEDKIADKEFYKRYNSVIEKFDKYMNNTDTWFNKTYPEKANHRIAYFSAEYGLSEVLPIYSGGLGILSGDHCKSASDLGIPFTAIGLFYKQGYFKQRINREGWQETEYRHLDPNYLPIMPVYLSDGREALISVDLPGRKVYVKIWQVKIGRVSLYLMDTDIEQNQPYDRELTSRLYGGNEETRIQQEILLGIGGLRVLDALNIKATVYHMNEGHSAFLGLELIRKLIQEKGLLFREALEAVSSCTIFTTHTPVPAGNDVFPFEMIDTYFNNFWNDLGISRHEFMNLGFKIADHQNFNMTVLALSVAGRRNGVSKLHGAVTRNMFRNIWPNIPEDEIPISSITNGIHTMTWLSPDFKAIYRKYVNPSFDEKIWDSNMWENVSAIPDEELWYTHCTLKLKMIMYLREKIKEQRKANGEPYNRIKEAETLLDPNVLTIGFARRFATYKRANLIFRNFARIQKILNNPAMPIQIIFAGKAHPADYPAQEVIKNISDIARQEGFNGKVIIVENYNMTTARYLVQGVDIWLNNPRRPLEASGTSGQKAGINGVINFSILDGWWCEGYDGKNGWAIGMEASYDNEYYQDEMDSESIYEILENEIIPLYYRKDQNGIPSDWIKVMKESIKTITPNFSTHRMVQDYTREMYIPSIERVEKIVSSDYKLVKDIASWKNNIEKNWSQVSIYAEKSLNSLKEHSMISGQSAEITALVRLGELSPEDVKVEIYYGEIAENNTLINPVSYEMQLSETTSDGISVYKCNISIFEGGEYGYTFRVIPYNTELINKFDTGLVKWVV